MNVFFSSMQLPIFTFNVKAFAFKSNILFGSLMLKYGVKVSVLFKSGSNAFCTVYSVLRKDCFD